jgi:hypothetical protein
MKVLEVLPNGQPVRKRNRLQQAPETGSPGSVCHGHNKWCTITHAAGSWGDTLRVCLMMSVSVLAGLFVLFLLMH